MLNSSILLKVGLISHKNQKIELCPCMRTEKEERNSKYQSKIIHSKEADWDSHHRRTHI